MKKSVTFIIAICALTLSGCKFGTGGNFPGGETTTTLATPSPKFNKSSLTITWSSIAHASGYKVKVDSGSYFEAISPYDVSAYTKDVKHTFYVKAIGDGEKYLDSKAGSTSFTISSGGGGDSFSFDQLDYEMKSGHSESELKGAPWINSNLEGMAKIVKKPSEKDDFYLSANYEDFQNDVPGPFDTSSNIVNNALGGIFSDTFSTVPNGTYIRTTRSKMVSGDSTNLYNYLFSGINPSTYISTSSAFKGKTSLLRVYKDLDDGYYHLEFNDGYTNGAYGIQTLAFYYGTQFYTYGQYVIESIYEGLGMNSSSAQSYAATGMEALAYLVTYPNSSSSMAGYSDGVISVNDIGGSALSYSSKLKSALLDIGLKTSDSVYISQLSAYQIDRMYYYFSNNESYFSYALPALEAFEHRHLIGVNAYKIVSAYLGAMGGIFGGEIDLRNYDNSTATMYMTMNMLSLLIDKAFITIACSATVKNTVAALIEDIISEYKNMVDEATWLSAATRNKIVTKLDKMGYTSVYSDKIKNFQALSESGINSMTLMGIYDRYMDAILESYLDGTMETNTNLTHGFSVYTVNAFYAPSSNQFVILGGLLAGGGFTGSTTEELYARVGVVIGHEISHAFDANGALYNEYGEYNQNGWWASEDMTKFKNKVQNMATFLSKICLFDSTYIKGDKVNTEATADMGGMHVMLKLAKKVSGFNYDKFFRSYVGMWREVYDDSHVQSMLGDVHPFGYIRGNVVVAQFDEFVETYGLQAGDGMYIPASERVAIW